MGEGTMVGDALRLRRYNSKGYAPGGEFSYLESLRPGAGPDLTDAAVRAAADEQRSRIGRNRRSTFLTGPAIEAGAGPGPTKTLLGADGQEEERLEEQTPLTDDAGPYIKPMRRRPRGRSTLLGGG